GRMVEKLRKNGPVTDSVLKKGRASAAAASSYCAAIDATSTFRGASAYRRRTRFLSNCSSSTRCTASAYRPCVFVIVIGPNAQPDPPSARQRPATRVHSVGCLCTRIPTPLHVGSISVRDRFKRNHRQN